MTPGYRHFQKFKSSPTLILKPKGYLDVVNKTVIRNPVVIIKDAHIYDINPSSIPPGQVIETNLILLPGFIDCHVHTTFSWDILNDAYWTLYNGFTTVRSLGDDQYQDLSLRDDINSGKVIGPNIIAAGCPVFPDSGGDHVEEVHNRFRNGSDLIKVFQIDKEEPSLDRFEVRQISQAARSHGLDTAIHAHYPLSIVESVLGGCRSIEHGTFIDDLGIRLMAETGTFLVPTASFPDYYFADPRQPRFDPVLDEMFHQEQRVQINNFRRGYLKGVKIAYGSDAMYDLLGHDIAEMNYLTQFMPKMEAIKTATVGSAELLRLDHVIGKIEKGYRADIIGVTDLDSLNVEMVIKGGDIIRS